ncbi:MAG: hypothetical protein K2X39_05780 [Silvanigrellaceae bacterium]|nr:hypothetical protein [Silvanigrellaceae bacterium]
MKELPEEDDLNEDKILENFVIENAKDDAGRSKTKISLQNDAFIFRLHNGSELKISTQDKNLQDKYEIEVEDKLLSIEKKNGKTTLKYDLIEISTFDKKAS